MSSGRLKQIEALESRAMLAGTLVQVNTFATWNAVPRIINSTDPAGIAYHPPSDRLIIADSEINEMSQFNSKNIFFTDRLGKTVTGEFWPGKSKEPTGIAWNEADGFFYLTNDDAKTITRFDMNLNAPLGSVGTSAFGVGDPEDITTDPSGLLYVVSGHPPLVGIFDSKFKFIRKFPTSMQMTDAEGIAYNKQNDHLLLVSAKDQRIFEYTLNGEFVEEYWVTGLLPKPQTPQGLVFAPCTDIAALQCLYIADGGIDNKPDGRIYEVRVGEIRQPVAFAQSVSTNEDTAKAITLTGNDLGGRPISYIIDSLPLFGTLTGTAPSLTYTPYADFHGADSFQFTVSNGTSTSGIATVSLAVTTVNDPPVAGTVSVTTQMNAPVPVLLSGTDLDGDVLNYSISSGPASGNLTGIAPNLTYTPTTEFAGTDTFSYQVNDASSSSPTVRVSIIVKSPPLAHDQTVAVSEDISQAITLTGSDQDSLPLSFIIDSTPLHGILSGTAPALFYTPSAEFNGSDSFRFKVNNGAATSADATVSIGVSAVNDPPVAEDVVVTTTMNVDVVVALSGTDVDDGSLNYLVIDGPTAGILTGAAPHLTYTPALGFVGTDTFTYQVTDTTISSQLAIVTVHVGKLPAIADSQTLSILEDTAQAITLTGSDPNGIPLIFILEDLPTHGTLIGSAPNLVYLPSGEFSGTDSFGFKVNNGFNLSESATISIEIISVNDPPVAVDQTATTDKNTPVSVALSATDVDSPTWTYAYSNPANGSLTGTAPNLSYTPTAGFHGIDSFLFQANDGTHVGNIASVMIKVRNNSVPTANHQSVTADEDIATAITLTGIDFDGDPLNFDIDSVPSNGTLTGTSPNLIYTPNPNFNGVDSFHFQADDGLADSQVATVSIAVRSVNDPPVAHNLEFNSKEIKNALLRPKLTVEYTPPTSPPAPIIVAPITLSLTNPNNPYDVNNDTTVTTADALVIINRLNGPVGEDTRDTPGQYLDVTGDGVIAPHDLLMVINYLNCLTIIDLEGAIPVDAVSDEVAFKEIVPEGEAFSSLNVASTAQLMLSSDRGAVAIMVGGALFDDLHSGSLSNCVSVLERDVFSVSRAHSPLEGRCVDILLASVDGISYMPNSHIGECNRINLHEQADGEMIGDNLLDTELTDELAGLNSLECPRRTATPMG